MWLRFPTKMWEPSHKTVKKNKRKVEKRIKSNEKGEKLDKFGNVRRNKRGKAKLTTKQKYKDIISLYDDLVFTKMAKGTSKYCRRIPKEDNKIGVDFLGTYDGENVTFYYLMEKMPKELFIDWKDRIRDECREGVRVTFLNNIRRHRIEWESPQMQSRLRILRQVSEETNDKDINAYNLHKSIKDMSKQRWVEDSLMYLSEADKDRGRALMKNTVLMIVSGKKGEDFDDSVKLIEEYSKHIGVGMTRILYDIPKIIRFFSPFNHSFDKDVIDGVPTQVISDEILARFNTYNQGTLGVGGMYFGTDIYSGFPVLKVVKPKEDTAENWLVTAETGGGKSFLVKAMLLQLLGEGYNGTIMDVEGFEYLPLANFVSHESKVEIINMGEGSGKYFDPVEIAEMTGIPEIDKDAKTMSINFTISIFKVLLGKAYLQDTWLDTVLNDAVTEVYKDAGVTDEMATWHLARGLSLFQVYEALCRMERFRDEDAYRSAVNQAIAITSKYFEPDGTRSAIFKERVKVSDIVDADLVICSFGMAGKSPQSIDEVQLALMQLGAAQLSHQRSIFSKSRGKFNFKLWEEFQRWGKFPDSDKTLGVALTGGRKLGDVNIIITNVVKELLDDDRFGIFGNTTSFLAGAIGDEKVRREFCDRLSVPKMKREMDLLASAQQNKEAGEEGAISKYQYAFLCGLDRSKYGIVKMLIPHDVAKTKLFKTGIDLVQ